MTDCTVTALRGSSVSELVPGFVGRQLQEFFGRQSAPRKTGFADRPLEVIHFVDADADGRMSWAFRLKVNCGFALQFAVDVAPEFLPIVDHGDAVPDIQRVQLVAKQQRFIDRRRVHERIQAPLVVDHADLEQEAGVGIFAGLGILLGQMKPALLGRAAGLRAEDGFEGKSGGSGQRMFRDKQRVVDAVELDRLPQRRLDDVRVADNR